jgi:hypothetical protein
MNLNLLQKLLFASLILLMQAIHGFAQDNPSQTIQNRDVAKRHPNPISTMQVEPVRFLESVAYGNGTFVAVGDGLTILTSKDGANWINRSSEIANHFVNINFTTETYAAGGDEITIALSDKSFAEAQKPSIPLGLRAVGYGGGVFVAVGDCGEILTSPNGEHWTSPISGISAALNGVAWDNSCFVVVGDGGKILTSPDGMTWTSKNSGTTENLFGVAYGNGLFTAVGNDGIVLTSGNGMEWISQTNGDGLTMTTIAFGNGIFMASSKAPDNGGLTWQTWTSTDGNVWKEVAHPGSSDPVLFGDPNDPGIADGFRYRIEQSFGGGLFFATTSKGLYTSRDGDNWTASEPRWLRSCCNGVAFGNGIYVAVGAVQATAESGWLTIPGHGLATSKDGAHWLSQYAPSSRLRWGSLMQNGRTFMDHFPTREMSAVPFITPSIRPNYLYSQDGITWFAPNKISIAGRICGNIMAYYYNGKGNNRAVLYSEDGIAWKRLSPINSDEPAAATQITSVSSPTYSDVGFQIQLNGQAYKLNLTAKAGEIYELQASTNLVDWVMLTTLTNSGSILNFVDPDEKNYPQRFYRLKLQ